jgi:hypothetical protein
LVILTMCVTPWRTALSIVERLRTSEIAGNDVGATRGIAGRHAGHVADQRPRGLITLGQQPDQSLTKALRNLERDGLISRTVYPTIPPRVEYALTDLGSQAGVLTSAIADWSVDNASSVLNARSSYDNRPVPLHAPVGAEDAARSRGEA